VDWKLSALKRHVCLINAEMCTYSLIGKNELYGHNEVWDHLSIWWVLSLVSLSMCVFLSHKHTHTHACIPCVYIYDVYMYVCMYISVSTSTKWNCMYVCLWCLYLSVLTSVQTYKWHTMYECVCVCVWGGGVIGWPQVLVLTSSFIDIGSIQANHPASFKHSSVSSSHLKEPWEWQKLFSLQASHEPWGSEMKSSPCKHITHRHIPPDPKSTIFIKTRQ
jgi:hypothetical protein